MQVTITNECKAVVIETVKADAANEKRWVKAADMLRAEGVTADMLGGDKEFRAQFKEQVVLLSFTKTEQAIMAKPQTSLSDEEKVTRRWVQQQLGNRLDRVQKYVAKAEREEELSDDDKGAQRVATLETRLKKDLTKWIEKLEKQEGTTSPLFDMLKALRVASALIK